MATRLVCDVFGVVEEVESFHICINYADGISVDHKDVDLCPAAVDRLIDMFDVGTTPPGTTKDQRSRWHRTAIYQEDRDVKRPDNCLDGADAKR